MTTSVDVLPITKENVQAAYIAYFGRPADPAGLNFWLNAGTDQTTMLTIMRDFAQADEFTAAYAGKTGAAFVNAVYLNVFGHNADPVGLGFYANALAAGTVTYGDVVYNILNGALGTDKAVRQDFGSRRLERVAIECRKAQHGRLQNDKRRL